jgi:hypothetical protein
MTSRPRLGVASFAALLASAVPARAAPGTHELRVAGAVLEVEIDAVPAALPLPALLAFIERTGDAVGAYFGGFPVPRAVIHVELGPGRRGFGHGNARYARLPRIRLVLGSETEPNDLRRDWVLAHELVHLGFPSVDESHHWMEEGLATYVEPVARARAGQLPVAKLWAELVEGLPKGLPAAGDRGLDRTPTWGRTYWGGALFWLLADVEIRSRTDNRHGTGWPRSPPRWTSPPCGGVSASSPATERSPSMIERRFAAVRRAITKPNGSRKAASSPAPLR